MVLWLDDRESNIVSGIKHDLPCTAEMTYICACGKTLVNIEALALRPQRRIIICAVLLCERGPLLLVMHVWNKGFGLSGAMPIENPVLRSLPIFHIHVVKTPQPTTAPTPAPSSIPAPEQTNLPAPEHTMVPVPAHTVPTPERTDMPTDALTLSPTPEPSGACLPPLTIDFDDTHDI